MKKENTGIIFNKNQSLSQIVEELEDYVSKDNPIDKKYFVETGVTPESRFYEFSISFIIRYDFDNYYKQITLQLFYEALAPFFVLRNCFTSGDVGDFWGRFKRTNLFSFVEEQQIKPIRIYVSEEI